MIQEKHFNYYFTKKREFESQKTPVQKLFHFYFRRGKTQPVFQITTASRELSANQNSAHKLLTNQRKP